MQPVATNSITIKDLGVLPYRQAWDIQEQTHSSVVGGGNEVILLVEHTPVVTLGRREDSIRNLRTPPRELGRHNVQLVHSDRGGDITYHGPGQIVVYPIIRIADHRLSVSGYVHRLESIIIAMLAEIGISAHADPNAVGVWVRQPDDREAKICAIGVRIRRGVTLHGVALNVTTDLSGFDHIVPCGLQGRSVTSVQKMLDKHAPAFEAVKQLLIRHFARSFSR